MRNRSIKFSTTLASGVLLALCAALPARAFDCPTPQAAGQPGVIAETPDEISALSKVFATGGAPAQIPVVVAELKQRHPDASNAALTNYLLTAYCPSVRDDASLNDGDRTFKMRAFAGQLMQYLY